MLPINGELSQESLARAFERLDDHEKMFLGLRFGVGTDGISREINVVGNLMGLTRAKALQLEERVFRKLRHFYREK